MRDRRHSHVLCAAWLCVAVSVSVEWREAWAEESSSDSGTPDWLESEPDLILAIERAYQNKAEIANYTFSGTCFTEFVDPARSFRGKFKVLLPEKACRLEVSEIQAGSNFSGFEEDRVVVVADQGEVAVAKFAAARRPFGCEVELRKDSISVWHIATWCFSLDPRKLFRNPLVPDRSAIEALAFLGKDDQDENVVVYRLQHSSGNQMWLHVAKNHTHAVVGNDTYLPDGTPQTIRRAEWDLKDGHLLLRRFFYSRHSTDGVIEQGEYSVENVALTPFENDSDEFTARSLFSECPTTRVIDRKPGASNPIARIGSEDRQRLSELDDLVSTVDEIEKIASSQSIPIDELPQDGVNWLLVTGNSLAFIAILIGIVILRRRDSRKSSNE